MGHVSKKLVRVIYYLLKTNTVYQTDTSNSPVMICTKGISDELKAKDAVHVLKLLFSVGDMEEEGHPLEILDLCKMHNKDIYDIFMDLFRDNVAEDWNFGDDWLDDEEDDYE